MNSLHRQNMSKKGIDYLCMDVDGTLTDGKVYISQEGELFKTFNVKDGYAIKDILPQKRIIPIIITGRESVILENRAKELNIKYIYQDVKNKKEFFREFINEKNIDISKVSFIGDDLNDLEIMLFIKENGGFVGCPRDAAMEILEVADFISCKDGGNGAVREFVEQIF